RARAGSLPQAPARCRRRGSGSRRAPRRHPNGGSASHGPGKFRGVNDFRPGLEGVVAFRTEIAEPDREGGSLRYRGVNIEELVGKVPFEQVWGLLVDESPTPGLPPAEPYTPKSLTGNAPADLQSALAALSAEWKLGKLI